MNVREIAETVELIPNYCEINREERNYAAILFAALCKPENASRFIEQLRPGSKMDTGSPEFGIYLEYSYLRDLWNKITDNSIRIKIICQKLKIDGIDEIKDLSIRKINEKFGVFGNQSKDFVQYPGNWSIPKFGRCKIDDKYMYDNDDFKEICKFKWAFNIKPDIVIHLDRERTICIEAKYASGEGSYPTSPTDIEVFQEREIDFKSPEDKKITQIELQDYMMTELLGLDTKFTLLVRKGKESGKNKKLRVLHWKTAFSWLDLADLPCFAIEMIRKISEGKT